jgi:hypothetical protein
MSTADRLDPLDVLERLLIALAPEEIVTGDAAFRRLVRQYARQERSGSRGKAELELELRKVVTRARPTMMPSDRNSLLERLLGTFRIWYR